MSFSNMHDQKGTILLMSRKWQICWNSCEFVSNILGDRFIRFSRSTIKDAPEDNINQSHGTKSWSGPYLLSY